ncbi:hypothetical protein ACIBLA_03695 [Streptomyces sp. NPDC050433]
MGTPLKVTAVRTPAPPLGADTGTVLREWADVPAERLGRLRAAGVLD